MDITKKESVIQALVECKGIVTDACNKVGISRSTFYLWKETDPQFAAAVKDAEEQAIDFVEGKLFKLIENEDVTSTIFFLKTRGKNRGYIERQEVTGKDGGDLFNSIKIEIVRTSDKSE